MSRWLVIFSFLSLVACGPETLINQTEEISQGAWGYEDSRSFEVFVEDTLTPYSFFIHVRNGGNYAYQNLIIKVKTYFPNNTFKVDTIDCPLADQSGRWLGQGLGDLMDNRILFKRNVQMPMTGHYVFELQHAMRGDTVQEIYDIGIAIEQASP